MNGECCGSRKECQANDILATLVVVYYTRGRNFNQGQGLHGQAHDGLGFFLPRLQGFLSEYKK